MDHYDVCYSVALRGALSDALGAIVGDGYSKLPDLSLSGAALGRQAGVGRQAPLAIEVGLGKSDLQFKRVGSLPGIAGLIPEAAIPRSVNLHAARWKP